MTCRQPSMVLPTPAAAASPGSSGPPALGGRQASCAVAEKTSPVSTTSVGDAAVFAADKAAASAASAASATQSKKSVTFKLPETTQVEAPSLSTSSVSAKRHRAEGADDNDLDEVEVEVLPGVTALTKYRVAGIAVLLLATIRDTLHVFALDGDRHLNNRQLKPTATAGDPLYDFWHKYKSKYVGGRCPHTVHYVEEVFDDQTKDYSGQGLLVPADCTLSNESKQLGYLETLRYILMHTLNVKSVPICVFDSPEAAETFANEQIELDNKKQKSAFSDPLTIKAFVENLSDQKMLKFGLMLIDMTRLVEDGDFNLKEIVMGSKEDGETVADTLTRELHEEAHIHPQEITLKIWTKTLRFTGFTKPFKQKTKDGKTVEKVTATYVYEVNDWQAVQAGFKARNDKIRKMTNWWGAHYWPILKNRLKDNAQVCFMDDVDPEQLRQWKAHCENRNGRWISVSDFMDFPLTPRVRGCVEHILASKNTVTNTAVAASPPKKRKLSAECKPTPEIVIIDDSSRVINEVTEKFPNVKIIQAHRNARGMKYADAEKELGIRMDMLDQFVPQMTKKTVVLVDADLTFFVDSVPHTSLYTEDELKQQFIEQTGLQVDGQEWNALKKKKEDFVRALVEQSPAVVVFWTQNNAQNVILRMKMWGLPEELMTKCGMFNATKVEYTRKTGEEVFVVGDKVNAIPGICKDPEACVVTMKEAWAAHN